MIKVNSKVPAKQMGVYHNLIMECGGSYISSPKQTGEYWNVSFIIDDYEEFENRWNAYSKSIDKSLWDKIKELFKW